MEKSTIIRLRQAESSTTNSNGDYQVSLKEGVNIEEGDQVRVHSVILDTATESVINIEVIVNSSNQSKTILISQTDMKCKNNKVVASTFLS